MTAFNDPIITFTEDDVKINISKDRNSIIVAVSQVEWTPVRLALASLTPSLDGLVLKKSVDIVIQPDTLFNGNESLLCVTLLNAMWPRVTVSFSTRRAFWGFVEAFAKAKRDADQRQQEVTQALAKLREKLSRSAEGQDEAPAATTTNDSA
ncbi:hypothetical protein ONZ51_g10279 [Trametes cubensis]|uniref:Uncharacterized protein n=1 Tax=Trametes cubensis TaxID=1111947 RepID=A0AAD7TJT7_9APHY|nr:hypothetical protein ONZ51_g10279 [Trametes cubensis]